MIKLKNGCKRKCGINEPAKEDTIATINTQIAVYLHLNSIYSLDCVTWCSRT